MEGIDPDVLLEWLQTGIGDERDLQLMALEQLCMLLLMADNIDRCFESCPPRTFIPALCKIFLDETAPDNVLEVTARAITYYLDVSNECTRRITQVDGAVKAICARLAAAEMTDRSSKDLAEQCVKLLEHVCQRETLAVYDAGGINAMLTLVRQHGGQVHKDTMHSAMSVVTRLCGKMEPNDSELPKCAESLGALLEHDDLKVSESALRCFAALTDRFIRKMMDPAELALHSNLIEHLLGTLSNNDTSNSANFVSIVLSLLSNLCRGSSAVTEQILSSPNIMPALSSVLTNKEERVVTDGLRLVDLLLVLLCEGRSALPHTAAVSGDSAGPSGGAERVHRHLIDAIRQKDLTTLVDAIENGTVDVNFTDDVGQTLCNWASAFGSLEMVQYLCDKGADVNKGHKSSSLHYAACFGRPDIVKLLLQRGANPDLRDEDGKTALDKSRERSDEDHTQVAHILESPSVYMHAKTDETKTKKDSPATRKMSTNSELPDRALVTRVLQQLLPIFCEIFQKSLNANVRRTSLSLLRKIVEHSDLKQAASNDTSIRSSPADISAGAESLVAVVVSVLDQEDDHEGQEQVLLILSSLLRKDSEFWVTELVRLGVFERVKAMAKEPPRGFDDQNEEDLSMEDTTARISSLSRSTASTPSIAMEAEIEQRATPIGAGDENERERVAMLNIAVESDGDLVTATQTPPPTVEVGEVEATISAPRQSSASAILNVVSKLSGSSSAADKKYKMNLVPGVAYRWKEWRISRGTESLFVWSDVLLIELAFDSNGWFRYLVDNEVHTMYVSGTVATESATTTDENLRKEMVARWKLTKAPFDDDNVMPASVLGIPSNNKKLEVPVWELWSTRTSELMFRCTHENLKSSDNSTALTTTIKDDSGGFVYESSSGRKHNVMPETALPSDFHTGWSAHGVSGRRIKFRTEIQRRKVQGLAWKLWIDHLKEAQAKPREALVRLEKAVKVIDDAVRVANASSSALRTMKHKNMKQPRIERVQDIVSAMKVLYDSIVDDRRLSTFEFTVSGIVLTLNQLLELVERHPDSYPATIFKETFSNGDALSRLALKMVAVLEASEKFPQYLYDVPGGSAFGLQLLSRRVRSKIELAPPVDGKENDENHLLNKSGKVVKCEPLASVNQMKQFLLKLVAKQWHDRERSTHRYVKMINDAKTRNEALPFRYTSDFDDQGIIYWLGTNGRGVSDWTNPASINVIKIASSDARQPFGKPEDVVSRDVNPINCHSSDDKNAHFTIDLGLFVYPNAYSLRHARGYGRSALRNWLLQGSKDKQNWEVIHAHTDDTSLGEPGSTASWHLEERKDRGPFRFIRIAQNGKNSSGQTHYLSISGFEIYGDVVDVIAESLSGDEKSPKEKSKLKIPTLEWKTPSRGNESSSSGSGRSSTVVQPGVSASAMVAHMPQGKNNNKLKAGLSVETVALMQSRLRMRMSRQNKGGASSANDPRGMRVVRGKDWRWEDQDGGAGSQGRVVSGAEAGWVDVLWDNGHTNSYRYGAEGHFDIENVNASGGSSTPTSATPSSVFDAVRTRSRGLMAKTSRSGTTASPATSTPFSRFSTPRGTATNASAAASSSTSTPGAANSGSIGKKSMSTTNLVDEKQRRSGVSVASTGQAASAESLQHQTPSLENLLAHARPPTFGRIAENQEQEDREDEPMGGEESDSAASMHSAASSHADMSISSSQSSVAVDLTPRDSAGTPSTPQGEKMNNLSVSAPDLAAARQRQQSSDTADTADKQATDEEEAVDDEDEDEEEEEEAEDMVLDALQNTGERRIIERLREVLGTEESLDQLLGVTVASTSAAQETSSSSSATTNAPPKKKSLKSKIGSYADVIKGLMQTMMDPSSNSMEMDEMMDDDDYYDYSEEGNEDETDDRRQELAAQLGLPFESFSSMISSRGTLSWKQLSQLMTGSSGRDRSSGRAGQSSGRGWEDELVVKCQYPALIPAFDPRPGRSNVNQTLDVELPTVVQEASKVSCVSMSEEQQLRLYLRGPNMSGVNNITIEMKDDDASVFKYVQYLVNTVNWTTKSDRTRRIWEPTYTVIYEDASEAKSSIVADELLPEEDAIPPQVKNCLEVIGRLSRIGELMPEATISPTVFISDKLTLKLTQELSDALVVAARSLPEWCSHLVYSYPCLFSVDTRNMYMQATAFGVSRTVVWLQSRRDAALERARGGAQSATSGSSRPHDRYHEYRVGRLRHERVKVTRSEELLLDQAVRLMKFHAMRKAVLEIEYTNEEGTGLGPTLEFYALVAAEIQRKALAIWVCDDDDTQPKNEERELDLGEGKKPAGYYVRRPGGLFPAPLPPHTDEVKEAAEMFRVLGIFLAKVLQDGRLVDLPLSRPFIKLLVHPQVNNDSEANPLRVLTLDDFEEVNPVKGGFLKELRALAQRKRAIENEPNLDLNAKRRKIGELKLHVKGTSCRVEELALSFTVNPPSKVFKYEEMELVEGGADIDVTMDNVEQYVEKCEDFYLNSGIAHQMRAFREGFDRVFPLSTLRAYSPEEVQRLLSGEQCPEWTREDVLNFTEPKLGYTRESPGFLRFVDVMVGLNGQERKNFLQFATGCSSLPPGGLANLHPRLTVVRKVESGDGSYPSVNTCVHYLKLPEYSSADILRERLLTAVNEKGFHLN
ncbi:unnamed protein product [Caenorhabditis auriculariae]|uniref:E3 ubiquitin-protein ligase n=1 Tax=Caenorhabditis auriculariae TaxID=2777116 RepID=A0A8S1HVI2_9PELO|nr:unnamed protein product [Caenorhabditis auriculariae]